MTETLDETEQGEEQEAAETAADDAPEQETEGEEAAGGEEQPEQPEQPAGVTDTEMEAILAKIDRSATTFRNRVSDLLGEQANDLSPCPLCADGIMGHLFPVEWITPVNELQGRLLEVLKTPSAPEYRDAPNVRQCGTCDGWGRVVSGSRVAGKESVVCVTCKGFGFQGENMPPEFPVPSNGEVMLDGPPNTTPVPDEHTDNWGTPRILPDGQENPNWGRQPGYWDLSLPHGGV